MAILLATGFAVTGSIPADRGHAADGDCVPRASVVVFPGSHVEFDEPLVVRLDGSSSHAGFGPSCAGRGLSFRWHQRARQAATIAEPTRPATDVEIHEPGLYSFLLEVTDEDGNAGREDASVFAIVDLEGACSPVATIESPREVLLPNGEPQTITLSGAGSTPGRSPLCDTLALRSFRWEALDGAPPPEPITGSRVAVTFETPGEYSYRLTVASGNGDRSAAEVMVHVRSFEFPARIVRGDTNADGRVDIGDALTILNFLFVNRSSLESQMCANAANTVSTDPLNVSDAIRLLAWLFQGGKPPDPPSPAGGRYSSSECGAPVGRTVDGAEQLDLGCENPYGCLQ